MLWEAKPIWKDSTAFLLGGGPSLQLDQIERLKTYHVIAINQARRIAPWAEVLYFGDCNWYRQNAATLHRFKGRKVTICSLCRDLPDYCALRCRYNHGLDTNPAWLASINSGYAAINLAYHFGVRRIALLGYDMHARSGANWHTDYKEQNLVIEKSAIGFCSLVEPLAAANVEVINTSEGSALTMFKYKSLDKVLKGMEKHGKQDHNWSGV